MALSTEAKATVEGAIVRTMRHGGFIGDIDVSNIRSRKTGRGATAYSATVKAARGGGMVTATYRATVGGGRYGGVTIKRVTEPTRAGATS